MMRGWKSRHGRNAGCLIWTLALGVLACGKAPQPDAYGNVEATEVLVSPEAAGQLTSFSVEEGQTLAAGAQVGIVDPAQLTLEREQLVAQRNAAASRIGEIDRQVEALFAERDVVQAQHDAAVAQRSALASQLEIAERNHMRTERLFAQQAATSQQLDLAERDDRVLQDQIKAQDQQIGAEGRQVAAQVARIAAAEQQRRTARTQVAAADAQVARLDERIRKSTIVNPSAGTVLVTYAKPGEVVQPGQPLYKIADLTSVDVRAYVAEPQLAAVKVGRPAQVTVDTGHNARQTMTGTISWLSPQAEFTPTPIQTRNERADLVYAVKIRVSNPHGVLKIGMPVDVEFAP